MQGIGISNFNLSYEVCNQSNEMLVIKMKGGLSYLVRKTAEPTYRNTTYVIARLEKINLEDLKILPESALTKLDKKILEQLKEQQERLTSASNYYPTMSYSLMARVDLGSQLVEGDEAIHSEMLGITLYIGEGGINKPALNTPEHTIGRLLDKNIQNGSLSTNIYLNDPKKVLGTLYTNVLGRGREIPVIRNTDNTPGLYISYSNNNLPDNKYYTIAELTESKLTELGVFLTKHECEKGGNTERFLEAEKFGNETKKKLDLTFDKLRATENNLKRAEDTVSKLNVDLTQLKHEHKLEIANMKINNSTIKGAFDLYKYEAKFKEMLHKSQTETLKTKNESSNWTDIAKSFATVAGVAFTGYQIFSS